MNLLKRITKRSTSDSHSNESTAKSSGDAKQDVEESKVPKSADKTEPNNVAAEVEEKLKIDETELPKSDEKTETPSTEATTTEATQTEVSSTDMSSTEEVKKPETTNVPETKEEVSADNNNEGASDNNNKKEEESTDVVNKSEDDKPVEQKIETPEPSVEEKVEEKVEENAAEEKTQTVAEVETPKADSKEDPVPDEPTDENKTTEKANDVSSESDDEDNAANDKPVHEEGDEEETLDEDQIKESPAYIPKGGQFYMHDQRLGASVSEVEAEEKKERQTRADTEKWSHDLFDERRQEPKTVRELENKYGYDIRSSEKSEDSTASAPQAVRRDRPNFRQNHRPQQQQPNRGSHRHVENNNEARGDRRNNRGHQRRNDVEDQWPALPSQEKRDQRQEKQPRSNNQDRNKSFEQADLWDEEPVQKQDRRQNSQPKNRPQGNDNRNSNQRQNTRRNESNQQKYTDGWGDESVNDSQSYQPKQDVYDPWGSDEEPQTQTNTSKQQDDLWDEPEPAQNRPQRSNFNHQKPQPRTFFNRSGGAADVRRNNEGQLRRSGQRDEPSGDFRNLNNAKPLSRREPRYARQNEDQGNSDYPQNNQRYNQHPPHYRGNRPPASHTNAIVPPPHQQINFNQQPGNQFGPMSSAGSQMSHGQVPYRQPTGVVYFDGPQQPREFVHRRDPRPLKFTAPAK
ncbi:Protein CASC3 [Aphelenchoides besseyi]|nr:Protein CASC3 [Aphelenchoides besseyi]KAI6225559.1 Protein CASC3 [Aphelenchoides besseyi]